MSPRTLFTRKFAGFTLIELLIVIAIILILIAIALPNFLEAQTRARVTRAEGEMRGLATALEAYRTDYTRYPPQAAYEKTAFSAFAIPSNVASLFALTTPIKYLTALPLDPFIPQDGSLRNGSTGGIVPTHPVDRAHGLTYFYWSQDSLRFDGQVSTADQMKRHGINWSLISVATDGDLDAINLNPAEMGALRINATNWAYSPTNGTKSSGDLSRVRP